VEGTEEGPNTPFLYLLLFESFCVHIWTFGLFFRSVADWRGPLTAAVSSGILYGAVAVQFFQEFPFIIISGILFAILWGVLYGAIRLRTGGLLGMVIIQALQSWSAWQLFKDEQPDITQLRVLYLVSALLFALVIWRLWPKKETDYRV
jgi:membrane protease YdiL (CAAX protease family)